VPTPSLGAIVQEYVAGTRTLESAAQAIHSMPAAEGGGMFGFGGGASIKAKVGPLMAYVAWLKLKSNKPEQAPATPFTMADWRAHMIKQGLPAEVFDRMWGEG